MQQSNILFLFIALEWLLLSFSPIEIFLGVYVYICIETIEAYVQAGFMCI